MKILLATDGSQYSRKAVEKCFELLSSVKDKEIKILSVVEPLHSITAEPFGVSNEYYHKVEDDLKKQANNVIAETEQLISQKEENVQIISQVLFGHVKQVIVEEAKDWGADLIVVGSHGYGFFGRVLLGSVSDFVLHHAPCSVLVVRTDKGEN